MAATKTKTTDLTTGERDMITAIGRSCYGEVPGDTIWSFDVCGTHSAAATLGSLVKKGYAKSNGRAGTVGDQDDATCHLTAKGVKAYYAMYPEERPAS